MKNVKLKVVLIFLALFMTQLSYSQMRGGGMGGGQGRGGQRPGGGAGKPGGQSMDISKIKFEESAGIIHYDMNEVFDKVKLKDKVVKEEVEKVLLSYKKNLEHLSVSHPENMKFFKEYHALLTVYMENRDMTLVRILMQDSKKHIFAISPVTKKFSESLNSAMKNILNEKEMKRWTKYMSSKTEKVFNVGNTTSSKQK